MRTACGCCETRSQRPPPRRAPWLPQGCPARARRVQPHAAAPALRTPRPVLSKPGRAISPPISHNHYLTTGKVHGTRLARTKRPRTNRTATGGRSAGRLSVVLNGWGRLSPQPGRPGAATLEPKPVVGVPGVTAWRRLRLSNCAAPPSLSPCTLPWPAHPQSSPHPPRPPRCTPFSHPGTPCSALHRSQAPTRKQP